MANTLECSRYVLYGWVWFFWLLWVKLWQLIENIKERLRVFWEFFPYREILFLIELLRLIILLIREILRYLGHKLIL